MSRNSAKNRHSDRLLFILSWLECQVWDEDGNVRPPRDSVWIILSTAMDGEMNPKYIYQVLKENRWNVAADFKATLFSDAVKASSSSSSVDGSNSASSSEEDNSSGVVNPRKTFKLIIPPSEWLKLEPKPSTYKRTDSRSGKRDVLIPPKAQWTNTLSELIWKQHEIPCAFVFKQGRVTKDPSLAAYYFTIRGHCSQPACGSKLEGYILNKPSPNDSVTLLFEADDTRKDKNHTKKRNCAGSERRRVTNEMGESSPAVFRRHEAGRLITRPGKKQPPILYDPEIYRKIKQEAREGVLNREKSATTMESVKILKHDPNRHLGSILDIGDDPIKVIYVTPGQILLNNSLKKQGYHQIQLDATGPYCRRLTLIHGLSGRILLYEFVAGTAHGTAQLLQMVTEKHDSVTIGHWIEEWLRLGALPPNEVISDDSPALLSALCRKLAQCTSTKVYKERCFTYLMDKTQSLPSCFVRLDHIHFIGKISKWKIWKAVENTTLKDHYLRFIGLLVLAESVEEFRDILLCILTLSLSETAGEKTPAEDARASLVQGVSGISAPDSRDADTDTEEEEDSDDEPESIVNFLSQIKEQAAAKAGHKGSMINPYYNSKFASLLLAECASFVLWSAVMVKPFRSPYKIANTSSMEGDFCDLKRRILRNEAKPMKLDVFINKHLQSINGQNLILSSQQTHGDGKETAQPKTSTSSKNGPKSKSVESEEEDEILTTDDEHDDNEELRARENWRNASRLRSSSPVVQMKTAAEKRKRTNDELEKDRELQEKPKEKKKKKGPGYLDKNPNIDTTSVDKTGRITQPKNLILRNGNLTGFFCIDDLGMCMVKNTCSFDSIMQLLTAAYIDNRSFRNGVEAKRQEVPALQVVSMFATRGGCKDVYQKRAEVLIPFSILENAREVSSSARIKSRKSMSMMEYTLAKLDHEDIDDPQTPNGKIPPLLSLLFKEWPSKLVTYECPANHHTVTREVVITPQCEILRKEGLPHLQKSVEVKFSAEPLVCHCSAEIDGSASSQDVLFIDLDQWRWEQELEVALESIPTTMTIQKKTFGLVGAVTWRSQHYVAYARRVSGFWEKCDDCNKKNQRTAAKTIIKPTLLVYVTKP